MNESEFGRSQEDYLEAMLILKERNGYIRSVDIAEQLEVTRPSVSLAVKRLREKGCLEMNRSGFITLTDSGMEIAEKIYTKHKTLTRFFISLGVNPETAQKDACRIEHDISDETFHALCRHAETGVLSSSAPKETARKTFT